MYENSILSDYEFDGYADNLDKVIGRTKEKMYLEGCLPNADFNRALYLSNCSRFLLTGPAGYGKSYLALCFAQTLKERRYTLYRIDCDDIMDQEQPDRVWKQIFQEITVRTDPEGEYCEKIFLYLEHPGALQADRKAVKAAATALEKMLDMDCNCILISTDIDGSSVPPAVLKQFTVLELELPDETARTEYFEQYMTFEIDNPENVSDEDDFRLLYPINFDEVTIAPYCAEQTEGLSFGQLKEVVYRTSLCFKQRLRKITGDDFEVVYSHVANGKGYFLEEEDFLEIISKVVKSSKTLERAESAVRTENSPSAAFPAAASPQIIYAMPPGMSGVPMAPGGVYGNAADAREQLLNAADSDNPLVSDLNNAFDMAMQDAGGVDEE